MLKNKVSKKFRNGFEMSLNVFINVYMDQVGVTNFSTQEITTKVERIMIYLHGNIQNMTGYRIRK